VEIKTHSDDAVNIRSLQTNTNQQLLYHFCLILSCQLDIHILTMHPTQQKNKISAKVKAAKSTAAKKTFKYVLVPENRNDPIEELVLEYSDATIVPCLTQKCNAHYSKQGLLGQDPAKREKYREGIIAQIQAKNPGFDPTQQPELVESFMGMQMCAMEPIVMPEQKNGWYGVSLYCDDSAGQKNSGVNERATAIMSLCGRPLQVVGDAFFSACRDDQKDLYERLDLPISEFSPDAKWVKQARNQALAKAAKAKKDQEAMEPKKVEPQVADAYRQKLQAWMDEKLRSFDEDSAVRTSRVEKHGSRVGYEEFLREKIEEKFKKSVKQ